MSTNTFYQEHFLAGKKIIVASAGIAGVLGPVWQPQSDYTISSDYCLKNKPFIVEKPDSNLLRISLVIN